MANLSGGLFNGINIATLDKNITLTNEDIIDLQDRLSQYDYREERYKRQIQGLQADNERMRMELAELQNIRARKEQLEIEVEVLRFENENLRHDAQRREEAQRALEQEVASRLEVAVPTDGQESNQEDALTTPSRESKRKKKRSPKNSRQKSQDPTTTEDVEKFNRSSRSNGTSTPATEAEQNFILNSFFREGSSAIIHGTGKPDFDGKVVRITGKYIKKKGRYPVQVEGGKVVRVKAFNLCPVINTTDDMEESLKRKVNTSNCIVCFDKSITHAIMPCGHMCLCGDEFCMNGCRNKCPICRGKVKKIVQVFVVENGIGTD